MKTVFSFLCFTVLLAFSVQGQEIDLNIYGQIDYTFWYNSGNLIANDLALYAHSDGPSNTGSSARGTRLGMDALYLGLENVSVSGKVEVDFWGDYATSGSAESRPQLRLRHAFLSLQTRGTDFNYGVLFGQTWSIVSSAFPSLINPAGGACFGNLWQRQPQIQFFLNNKLNETSAMNFKLALTRPMTGSSTHRAAGLETQLDAGDTALMPLIESEVNYNYNKEKFGFSFSISGAIGKEDYTADGRGDKVDVNLISGFIRLRYDIVSLVAKFYSGSNINLWFGGFGSNLIYDPDTGLIIDSNKTSGGFLEISVNPNPRWTLYAGYGFDDPDDQPTNAYYKNENKFAGFYYRPYSKLTFGMSYENFTTKIPTGDEIDVDRLMFLSRFSF